MIGRQNNKQFAEIVLDVWEAPNCFGDMAVAKIVKVDKQYLWAFQDSERRRDWIGLDDWRGVKKRLEEFYGRGRNPRN